LDARVSGITGAVLDAAIKYRRSGGEVRRDVLRILAECPGGLAGMSPRLAVTLRTKYAP
jgi:hypothetical protein